MNERWLAGDFAGVSPRDELPNLIACVRRACDEGAELRAFFVGLAAVDPVADAVTLESSDDLKNISASHELEVTKFSDRIRKQMATQATRPDAAHQCSVSKIPGL